MVEERALFQSAAHLVHAGHADVGARIHRPGGQVGVERQVGAPRLVDDQRSTTAMADLGDRRQVRARSVWGGAGHQRAPGVRVFGEGCGVGLGSKAEGLRMRGRSPRRSGELDSVGG